MALVGMDSATSATYGLEEYQASAGTLATNSGVVKYGNRSLAISPASWCTVRPEAMALTDAGGRITRWFRKSADPGAMSGIIFAAVGAGAPSGVIGVGVSAVGQLALLNGDGSTIKTGVGLGNDIWYRVSLSYRITSTTDWAAKVYYHTSDDTAGILTMSATNADATLVRTGIDCLYTEQGASGSGTFYFSPAVADGDTSLDDIGDVRCVPALPDAESATNFDTAIGNARSASDFNNVNERPLSETNGWRQAADTQVAESYIVEQTLSALDVDLTGKTILGHMGWCWSKKGADTFTPCTHRAAVSGTGNTTTGGTMVIPAGTATGDMLVVVVTSQGSTSGSANVTCTDNDSGGNTWTTITNTADKKAWMFAKRATSATAGKTITIANGVTKTAFGCEVFKDAATSLTVANTVINVSTESNASGNETHATFTPNVGGCAIGFSIHDYGSNNDATTQSTASLGAMTERVSHLPAGAGADCAVSLATIDGTSAAAAATGSITWAQTDSTTYSIAFAVRPEATWATADAKLIRDGTDVSITLTTSSKLFTSLVTSAAYPTGAFGMKSTGNVEDTDFYEGGALIAYQTPTETGTLDASALAQFSTSADLDAVGSMVAAASVAFSTSADLDAIGNLAVSGQLTLSTSADLTSPTLNDMATTATLAFSTAAALTAPGNILATASLAFSPIAVISAPGKLIAATTLTFTTAADPEGAVNAAATASLAFTTAAALKGAGELRATADLVFTAAGDLRAHGELSGVALMLFTTSAALADANAGQFPFINNPGALSGSPHRGAKSVAVTRSAVSSTVRRDVVKTT